jgi:YVTN family beta-propeller protein
LADPSTRLLYITHGNEVLVLDIDSVKQVASIANLKRVHGVALARELHKGFISDGGDNAIVVFDLQSRAVRQKIKVGNAPDAVLYEPVKKHVYAFNAHSHDASVIDAETEKNIATVPLPGIPEFSATDGKGNIFVNIENKNSLVRLNADGTKVQNEWSLAPCEGPSGLAMDRHGRRLFSVCDNKLMIVTDADSGKRIAQIPVGIEPDAAIYDPDQKLVFASNCDGTLTVIKQESPDRYTVLQNVQTQREARTMALDPVTHKLFLPYLEIKPGQKPWPAGALPEFTPGTFHLMVVAPQG